MNRKSQLSGEVILKWVDTCMKILEKERADAESKIKKQPGIRTYLARSRPSTPCSSTDSVAQEPRVTRARFVASPKHPAATAASRDGHRSSYAYDLSPNKV